MATLHRWACVALAVLATVTAAEAQPLTNKKPIVFIWAENLETRQMRPLGSGFVLGAAGDVLTARHVTDEVVEGERLVVSVASKSAFPVQVDMSTWTVRRRRTSASSAYHPMWWPGS